MKIGMLWFSDDKSKTIEQVIGEAATRYKEKYGITPNLCYANPRTVGDTEPTRVGDITLRRARSILPSHYWIGVSEN